MLPSVPIRLREPILDRDDGEALHQPRQVLRHRARVQPRASVQRIGPVLVELRRRDVECQGHVLAGAVARLLDRAHQKLEGLRVLAQVGGEAPLVADRGHQPLLAQELLQRVEHLGSHAQGFREGAGAHRHDHELLDVEIVVRVRAAVHHVHERDREGLGAGPTEVAVEREHVGLGGRLGQGDRDAEDRVGAQVLLVRGAVQLDEKMIQIRQIVGVLADQVPRDRLVDARDRLGHPLAEVALGVSVPELEGLSGAGRGPGGDRGTADGAAPEGRLDLDGRHSPGIQDLPGVEGLDLGHGARR